jgi:hypothetical protein
MGMILVVAGISGAWSLASPNQRQQQRTYQYFAIGSNMEPATMTSLRNIEALSSTAAILPGYELAFDIPGNPLVEPSAASVRRAPRNEVVVVHGVLYELTEEDFGRLGSSEGVPWVYRWESCRVIPYVGDGKESGEEALRKAEENGDAFQLNAYALSASPLLWRRRAGPSDIPPSKSYLKILQDGAAYWKLDHDYQNKLANISVSKVAPGVSGLLLQTAKLVNPR